jgi:hypothetical protein
MLVRQKAFVVEEDERTLVYVHSDGLQQLIVAEPAAWEERACRIAGRVLTEQEWRELIGTSPYAPACRN